jgi:hypothetical protein
MHRQFWNEHGDRHDRIDLPRGQCFRYCPSRSQRLGLRVQYHFPTQEEQAKANWRTYRTTTSGAPTSFLT